MEPQTYSGLLAHHKLMASYNQWMNARLLDLIKDTPDAVLNEDRGAFFSSAMGTLNHLYVADIIWLRRLESHPASTASGILEPVKTLATPANLSDVLYDRLTDLTPARTSLDALIIRYIDSLTEADLATPFSYRRVNGDAHTKLLGLVLSHVFNHQTHHRGQLTTLLSQMGLDIGVTDLLVRVPEFEL